jgi:hypothetical protein
MMGLGRLPRLRLWDCISARSSDVEGEGELEEAEEDDSGWLVKICV